MEAELNGKQSTNLASISLTKIKQMPVIVLHQSKLRALSGASEMSDSTARLQEVWLLPRHGAWPFAARSWRRRSRDTYGVGVRRRPHRRAGERRARAD